MACAAIRAQGALGPRRRFSLLHGLQARKHYSTYKLVWESMNSTRNTCIEAQILLLGMLQRTISLIRSRNSNRALRGAPFYSEKEKNSANSEAFLNTVSS